MKLRNEELEDFKNFLEKKGYKRFSGHFNNEDYGYWKSFDILKNKKTKIYVKVNYCIKQNKFSS